MGMTKLSLAILAASAALAVSAPASALVSLTIQYGASSFSVLDGTALDTNLDPDAVAWTGTLGGIYDIVAGENFGTNNEPVINLSVTTKTPTNKVGPEVFTVTATGLTGPTSPSTYEFVTSGNTKGNLLVSANVGGNVLPSVFVPGSPSILGTSFNVDNTYANVPHAGTYTIQISGVMTGINGGAAASNFSAEVAAVVPEPETYAMLLAGLGLVGLIARRRTLSA